MTIVVERARQLARLAEEELPEAWIPSAAGDTIVGASARRRRRRLACESSVRVRSIER